MENDPYKILESAYSSQILDRIGAEFIKGSPSKNTIEMAFSKVFWGKVGLSGFTLYPNIINYLNQREINNLSKQLLNYFYSCLDRGYSLEQQYPLCLLAFTFLGSKLYKLGIDKQTLSCVPKFLFRAIMNFSIHEAGVSVAKDYDESSYQDLHFVIISCYALLVYAYKRKGLTHYIKDAVIELVNAYNRNINIYQFTIYNLPLSLRTTDNIYHLIRYNIEDLIKNIKDTSIYTELKQLMTSESKEIIESVEKYHLNHIYDLEEYRNLSYSDLIDQIKNNYFRYICPSYIYLLDQSGKYYDEMLHLNIKYDKWTNSNDFDHSMIYMLAGWLLINRQYPCLKGISQINLASDITNYILNYIKGNN